MEVTIIVVQTFSCGFVCAASVKTRLTAISRYLVSNLIMGAASLALSNPQPLMAACWIMNLDENLDSIVNRPSK